MRTAYKSVRMFKSDFLEVFSHIHPLSPLLVWAPVAFYFIWRGISLFHVGAGVFFLAALGGLLAWTLAEYLLHRFVFHFPAKGEKGERFVFILHGIHHTDPVDPSRLVMSPVVAAVLALLFYYPFKLLLGAAAVNPFFAFFIIGYLCYDYVHFSVHHFTPRTPIGKYLKQSHMIHHYVNSESHWGVSSPLWDLVFGTLGESAPHAKRGTKKRMVAKTLKSAQVMLDQVKHGS